MNKKKGIVPKLLRFPEYTGNGLRITKLGKISSIIKEKAGENKYTLMSVTSGVGLVPQAEKFGREIAGDSYKNYIVIKKYDFAYNKSATKQFPEGYISMLGENDIAAVPNSIFTCFRITDNGSYPPFFDYLWHNNYHGHWLRKYIEVGARAHGALSVDTKYLWSMPLALPDFDEQQKIADCLSSIDELIDAESSKLKALEKHKKGLMQKLFPVEGKALPEWRFPEFKGCGEWKHEEIGKLGDIATGKTPSTSDAALWDGDIQFVTPTDITENKYQYHTQRTVVGTPKIKILPKHTIMFTCIASIGKMALSVYHCVTNQQINSIIPKPCYDNEFIYYSLLQKSFSIKTKIPKSTLPIINKTDFLKIKIPVVSDKNEQQKIANCLSEIDTMITEQSNKVKQLKKHKKGLMQGLFPSLEEADV
ncbi:restriction endonuclease subunit S [Neglecta sp. X4]|uniref:restriction endonuclease subunit S n=1 Tax=unclassified Neglectibacter TaxID=2632164 RepID=UPI00136DAD29|nr:MULTISPECIES: restriction endonuclease subunit S [unclassified Neglectibacter]NBI17951.1 restriction endonuclease subunit S [Neglectibacter sp. 59]NBJ73676.1 restriction endonuclease subunit S [Neglectibacter sp. X4]NCE81411.1 restriction endonuclease subunit S [Neglectibacter sp. X58]